MCSGMFALAAASASTADRCVCFQPSSTHQETNKISRPLQEFSHVKSTGKNGIGLMTATRFLFMMNPRSRYNITHSSPLTFLEVHTQ